MIFLKVALYLDINKKAKIFIFPPDILVAGSFKIHNNPKRQVSAITTNCIGVKGFLLSASNPSAFALLVASGFKPISPKIFCDNQNCTVPKNIKIPAKPKP